MPWMASWAGWRMQLESSFICSTLRRDLRFKDRVHRWTATSTSSICRLVAAPHCTSLSLCPGPIARAAHVNREAPPTNCASDLRLISGGAARSGGAVCVRRRGGRPPPQGDGPTVTVTQVCTMLLRSRATAFSLYPIHRVVGVLLADGSCINSPNVVITTGTFLRGMLHIGSSVHPAGRMPDPATAVADANAAGAASTLSATLSRCGFSMARLKTGTPPRLDGCTINKSGLQTQLSDDNPVPFSFMNGSRPAGSPWAPDNPLVVCHVTKTTAATEAVVAASPSAVYDGAGGLGVGPRYCPSLEAKAWQSLECSHQVEM